MPKANVNIDIEGASLRLGEATAAHVAAIGKADIIGLRLSEAKAELAAKETARGAVIQGLATGAGTATEDKPGTQVAIKSANQGVVDAQGRVATMQAVHDQALANAKAAESDKIRTKRPHSRNGQGQPARIRGFFEPSCHAGERAGPRHDGGARSRRDIGKREISCRRADAFARHRRE